MPATASTRITTRIAPLSSERVTQAIDLECEASFLKEVYALPIGGGRGALSAVRKRKAEPNGDTLRAPVVLIHGFAQNRYAWHLSRRSLVNYLADKGYDVWNLELRGIGRSRALGAAPPEHFEEFVREDVPAALEGISAVTGERGAFLVGHSMGGAVACAAAGEQGDRVRGVVSLSGLYGFGAAGVTLRWVARLSSLFASLRRGAAAIPTRQIGRLVHKLRKVLDSSLAKSLMPHHAWHPGTIEEDVLAEVLDRSFERTYAGVLHSLARAASRGGLVDRLGRPIFSAFEAADVPLLVLAASRDTLIDPRDAGAAFARSRSRDRTFHCFGVRDGGDEWGHLDIICGRRAPLHVWPYLRRWLDAR